MWEDAGYNGSKYVDYVPGTNVGDKFNIDGWNGDNEISSVINNTGKVAVLYDNDDYTGTKACVGANSSSSNLGVTNGFNDRAESFILKSSCS